MKNIPLYFVFVFLHLFSSQIAISQSKNESPKIQHTIDSLKLALKNAKHDTVSLYSASTLSNYYKKINLDSSIYFLSIAESKAKKLKDTYKLGKVMLKQADVKFLQNKTDESFKLCKQVEDLISKPEKNLLNPNNTQTKYLRALMYYQLGVMYNNYETINKSIESFKKAASLFEELKDTTECIRSYGYLGIVYQTAGKTKEAIENVLKGIKFADKPKYFNNAATLNGNVGMYYDDLGDYKKSLYHYTKAVEFDSINQNEEGILRHLKHIAIVYKTQGHFSKAIEINFKSLKRAEALKNNLTIGGIFSNIAIIYAVQLLYKDAEVYFQKALVCFKEVDSKSDVSNALGNIGLCYKQRADSAKTKANTNMYETLSQTALNYFNDALKLNHEINNPRGIAINLGQLASIYRSKDQNQKSLDLSLEGIKILESFNAKQDLAAAYSNVSICYVNLNNYAMGENYLLKSLKLANEMASITELKYCYDGLYNLYKKTNKPKEALKYYELYITINDSIKNNDNSKALVKQQLKYEYEKQAAADSVAHAKENEIKNVELEKQNVEIKAKKNQQYALFGGLGLVIIFAGFMYNRFKITQKQKEIIDEQKTLVENQKHLVEEKQKEVLDSIHYAKRIQTALMPSDKLIEKKLNKLQKKG